MRDASPARVAPIRCVELGAGCSGLPGMVTASSGYVDEVFFTDRCGARGC